MHVFVLLLLVASSVAVLDEPEDGNYDNGINPVIDEPEDGNDEDPEYSGNSDEDDEYPDPLWEDEKPSFNYSNTLENYNEESDPEDIEEGSFAYISADSWQCVAPSPESVNKGLRIIRRYSLLKIFPQHFLLSNAQAAAVSAYLRRHNPQALCPQKPTSVKFAVPIQGQCACFVKCDKAPKVISVERCPNERPLFQMNGPEKFLLRLDGRNISLDSTGGDCKPVRKGDPICSVVQQNPKA